MSEQEQRHHPYAYNLRFATKNIGSHEQIPFTAADAMFHAKEFDTMHQRIAALESELAASKRECEGLREVVGKCFDDLCEACTSSSESESRRLIASVIKKLAIEAALAAKETTNEE